MADRETNEIAKHIGCDVSCIHDWPGPGEIVRHAHQPMPEAERVRWERQRIEQRIASLRPDPAAVASRERRIAAEQAAAGRVLLWRSRRG